MLRPISVSVPPAFACPLPLTHWPAADLKCQLQGYGSGRQQIAGSGGAGAGDATLRDHLAFGIELGETPEAVQQQLAAQGLPAALDAEAEEYLAERRGYSEDEAYAVMEALAGRGLGRSNTLLRNQGRAAAGYDAPRPGKPAPATGCDSQGELLLARWCAHSTSGGGMARQGAALRCAHRSHLIEPNHSVLVLLRCVCRGTSHSRTAAPTISHPPCFLPGHQTGPAAHAAHLPRPGELGRLLLLLSCCARVLLPATGESFGGFAELVWARCRVFHTQTTENNKSSESGMGTGRGAQNQRGSNTKFGRHLLPYSRSCTRH